MGKGEGISRVSDNISLTLSTEEGAKTYRAEGTLV